jgi:hypothetical protein
MACTGSHQSGGGDALDTQDTDGGTHRGHHCVRVHCVTQVCAWWGGMTAAQHTQPLGARWSVTHTHASVVHWSERCVSHRSVLCRAIVAVLAEQDAQAPSGGSSQSGSTAALGALATGSSSLTGSNGGHNGSFISSSVTAGKHTGSSAGALFERSRDLELGASKKSEL